MGLLARLIAWFAPPPPATLRKAHPDLQPIDVDALVDELDLRAQAKRLGAAGVPAADATTPAGPELHAIQRVEKTRNDYVDWASGRLTVIHNNMDACDLTQRVNRALRADQDFEHKANASLAAREALLHQYSDGWRARKAELDDFRRRHRRTGQAEFPDEKWGPVGVLLAVIAVEGLANTTFFGRGVDTGLVGGAMYAFCFAAVNVIVAFAFGFFAVRHVNHVNYLVKLLGLTSLLISLVVMVGFAFGVAHFREAMAAGSADPNAAAWLALQTRPFRLHGFESAILCAVSLLGAVVGLLDGLKMDDKYPGYGKATRQEQKAAAYYNEQFEEAREALEKLKKEAIEELEQTASQAQTDLKMAAECVADKEEAELRLKTALRDADTSLNAVLGCFQTENEAARRPHPKPQYFGKPVVLPALTLPDFSTEKDRARLEGQRRLATRLMDELEDIRARIQAAFMQRFDALRPLASHFPGSLATGRPEGDVPAQVATAPGSLLNNAVPSPGEFPAQ